MATADTLPRRLEEAVEAINRGDAGKAVQAASKAMALAPENPDCHLIMAVALHNKGDLRQAEHHYIETLRLNPKQPRAIINLGLLKLNSGRGAEAVLLLEGAYKIDKSSTEVRHLLARAYGLAGRLDEAISHFEALLKTAGHNLQIMQGYATALAQKGRFDEALKTLKRADALNPGDKAIAAEIVRIRAAMGQEKAN